MKIGSQARSFGEGIYAEEEQFLSVVREAGELGIEGLEANWRNMERYFGRPETFGRVLDEAGLTLIGAHCGGALWDSAALPGIHEDVRRTAAFVKAVAGELVVLSVSRPKGEDIPDETWRMVGKRLNALGEVCRAQGAGLACHNHWWEPEGNGLDTLAAATDPALVSLAFDTGHYTRAGKDAAAAIADFGTRISIVHLADWDGHGRPPLGQGSLDLDAVSEALQQAGFDGWLVLEEQTEFGSAREQVANGVAVARRVAGRQ